MKRLLLALICVSLVWPVHAQTKYRHRFAGRSALFFDDFPGSVVDSAKWSVLDRIGDLVGGEVGCMVPANVSVSAGILSGVSKFEDHTCSGTIEAPQTMHYTSWEIQQKTAPFLYGTIEARMKLPGGTGIWPTFWLLGYLWQPTQPFTANTPGHNWPVGGWCEIDIAEFWQNGRTQVNTSAHVESADGLHLQNLPFDATTRFMVYRLVWTSTSLTWFVDAEDGMGFRQLYSLNAASGRVPTVPMYVVFSAQSGGQGGGTPDSATFPQTFQVDYVRVTQP